MDQPEKKKRKQKNTQDEKETIIPSEYSDLMQHSYIDYAMSVIVSRALPDIRDGLKPVQRRVLYDMSELGIHYNGSYRKSARIVGDTMGKYHPHGDSSIYDSLVVMAQDFKKELPLVDGHGNFGTIEGDGAAAMRYTEARLSRVSEETLLADLDKNVVDFVPNFDETEKEPQVLPAMIPNFLINGSEGIAVGMATSTPTHNVGEVIDAELALLENPGLSSTDLLQYIQGPDFPTGGIVINKDDLPAIYESGQGKIRIRALVETEKGKNGHILLVVKQIPYTMIGSGISHFLQDVASLSESRTTEDIVDISNQSSKDGIRIVIELKKGTDVENFKALLYQKTKLEDTFGVNMLAIRDGRPETLSLKEALQSSIDFSFEITRRKYEYLLSKEQDKREVQEGLIKACNVIDLIIEIIRGSESAEMAKKCLVSGETSGIRFRSRTSEVMAKQLQFTPKQADAILEMKLRKLVNLELNALIREHEETIAAIYRYEDILEQRSSMIRVIEDELTRFRKQYAKPRKTRISQEKEAVYVKPEETETPVLVLIDRFGYGKIVDPSLYEKNKEAIDSEYRIHLFSQSVGKLSVFTDQGFLHTVNVSDFPVAKYKEKGKPLDNLCHYDSSSEQIIAVFNEGDVKESRLLFVTKQGLVKLVEGSEFESSRTKIQSTKLNEDRLLFVDKTEKGETVVLRTADGYFLRFLLDEIPVQKKTARGVIGIRLSQGDYVEEVWLLSGNEPYIITWHDQEINLSLLRVAKRAEKGTRKGKKRS